MIVGGAQRSNKKKRQQRTAAAAKAVSAARGGRKDLTKIIIGVVVVLVIAGAVVTGVLIQKNKSDQAAQTIIPALTVPGSPGKYPVSIDRSTAVVTVGKPTAKVTVDFYEDLLCPVCGQFESSNFPNIEKQLEAGNLKANYHLIDLLNDSSTPAGYSTMSANTALAVATVAPGKFMDYHYSLYQKQPQENGPGWTQAQLTSLANRLGVSGSQFDSLVSGGTYNAQIQKNLSAASNNQSLWQTSSDGSRGFGTPTVVSGGKTINWQSDPSWLDNLVKTAYAS
jgi:protein-disulfide isomerase